MSTPRYPRAALIRRLRYFFILSRKLAVILVIVIYLPSVSFNVLARLEHMGYLTGQAVSYELLLEHLVPYLLFHVPVDAALAIGVLLYFWLVEWSIRDERREQAFLDWEEMKRALKSKNRNPIRVRTPIDLRSDSASLLGRTAEIKWLTEQLARRYKRKAFAITGLEGSGKKSLVNHVAHGLYSAGRFRDGVVVVDGTRHTNSIQALQYILQRFNYPRQQLPNDLDILRSSVRTLLKNRDVLILLYDVSPNLQLQDILPPLADAAVLTVVTTSVAIPHFVMPSTCRLELSQLDEMSAATIFVQGLGYNMMDELTIVQKAGAYDIVRLFGGHPQSLKITAAYLISENKQYDLANFACEVRNDPRRIQQIRDGVTPYVISLAFKNIESLSSPARTLLVALGAFAHPSFGYEAVKAVEEHLGLAKAGALRSLLSHRLICEFEHKLMGPACDTKRFTIERVIWLYVLAEFDEWRSKRDKRYIETYCALGAFYGGYSIQHGNDAVEFDIENIWSTFQHLLRFAQNPARAHVRRLDKYYHSIMHLCVGLSSYFFTQGQSQLSDDDLHVCCLAANNFTDSKMPNHLLVAADALHLCGQLYELQGQYALAIQAYDRCFQLRVDLGDKEEVASLFIARARAGLCHYPSERRGDWLTVELLKARDNIQQGIKIAKETENSLLLGIGHCELGKLALEEGDVGTAMEEFRQARGFANIAEIPAGVNINAFRFEGDMYYGEGAIAESQSLLEQAEISYKRALAVSEQIGDESVRLVFTSNCLR
jgi:tetratricopeptide (TPR) repeat protein